MPIPERCGCGASVQANGRAPRRLVPLVTLAGEDADGLRTFRRRGSTLPRQDVAGRIRQHGLVSPHANGVHVNGPPLVAPWSRPHAPRFPQGSTASRSTMRPAVRPGEVLTLHRWTGVDIRVCMRTQSRFNPLVPKDPAEPLIVRLRVRSSIGEHGGQEVAARPWSSPQVRG